MRLHARYATDGLEPTAAESLAHHWWEALKPPDATWVWEESAEILRAHRRSAASAQLEAGRRLEQRSAYDAASEVYVRGVELADEAGLRAAAEAALARTLARQGRGDDAWQHRLSAIDLYTEATGHAPAELYADMLEIATFNWGYFHQLPEDGTVLELLDAGDAQARAEGDRVSLARLIAERAAFTGDLAGTAEIRSLLAAEDAVPFADAAQRMATVELWNGRVNDAISIFATVFDRLIPGGAMINVPEALTWYGLAAFMAGDLDAAAALGERLNAEAAFRSIHTGSHASALVALVAFGRGDWELLARTVDGLRRVADEHPDAAFCLLGAATIGYGAARELIQGMPPRSDLDVTARRFVDDSDPVQAATILLPKAMAGDPTADAGLAGYADGLRLWDRYRVWDVADLMPAIAMAIRGRWDGAEPHLGRLDAFAAGGARLAAAVATAIREMQAEALGGPPASFEELHALGYDGLSQVLRHRPPTTTS
jgi:tetratricopeptide (TPR) repeat protein